MDLFGALGNPLKTSRTIIMSATSSKSRIDTIEKLLRITSYFIRCAAIDRTNHKLEDFDFQLSMDMTLPNPKGDVQQAFDDQTSSSSTLRLLSAKCSPLHSFCHSATGTNEDAGEQPYCHFKMQKCVGSSDNISSRSENALDVKDSSMEFSLKNPLSVGLRRTMSYTSRISSSAILDKLAVKEKQMSFDRESKACDTFVQNDPKKCVILNESNMNGQKFSHNNHPATDKVVFVLGENENLVGLKAKREGNSVSCGYSSKTTSEGREKQQEQPLSFSGSEVESGFSECESFELSPARSICGNLVFSKGRVGDASPAAQIPSVEPKLLISKNEKNVTSVTCSKSFLLEEEAAPLGDSNLGAVIPQSTFILKDKKSDALLLSSANLRSLARSVSVNLPVCLKSAKPELCTEGDLCVGCGTQIMGCEIKENMQPLIEARQICGKRSTKRLRRAHSSFCVQSQTRKSLKNLPVCLSCQVHQESFKGPLESYDLVENNSPAQSQGPEPKEMSCIELPLPLSRCQHEDPIVLSEWGVAGSLFGGVCSHYIPERALQGCAPLGVGWEVTLKRDLALEAQHPTLDQSLAEAVAIVANVDLWQVHFNLWIFII